MLTQDGEIGHNRGDPRGKCFEHHKAKTLPGRGERERIGRAIEGGHVLVVDRPQDGHLGRIRNLALRTVGDLEPQPLGIAPPRLAVLTVVKERFAPTDRKQGPAAQPAAGAGKRLEQQPTPLARLDPAHRQNDRTIRPPKPPAGGSAIERARRKPFRIDTIGDDTGLDAELLLDPFGPMLRDAQPVIDVQDRRALTVQQHLTRKRVHVMNRPHDRRDEALAAQRQHRPRRQAILGVVDVDGACGTHPLGQDVGIPQDP